MVNPSGQTEHCHDGKLAVFCAPNTKCSLRFILVRPNLRDPHRAANGLRRFTSSLHNDRTYWVYTRSDKDLWTQLR